MSDSLRNKLTNRMVRMVQDRSTFMSHWKEINEYISPRRGRFDKADTNKGDKRNKKIIDNTGTLALRTLSSGMMAGLTSPARPWFRLTLEDVELAEFGPVKIWLNQVERLMRSIYTQSNIYNVLPVTYTELGGFGTGAFLLAEDFQDVIRGYQYSIGEYVIATNSRGVVDTIYREMPKTVGQLIQQFGKSNVSRTVREMYNNNNLEAYVPCVHAIEPNDSRILGLKNSKNMPFRSVYYEEGQSSDELLGESGYEEFPVMVPRWAVNTGDTFGTSCPGMDALGDIKQLQMEQKRKGQAIEKMINPPLNAPSSMQNKRISSLPADINFDDSGDIGGGVRATYQIKFPLGDLKEDMHETRQRINSAFYADLFLMITQSIQRQTTAREIEERHEEKLLMLGPVLERINHEGLDPMATRTFNIAQRNNLLPPVPEDLVGNDLKIEYISILAQAQRAVGTNSIDRLTGYVGGVAQLKPDVIDKIDLDQSVDEMAEMLGVPAKIVVSDDDVAGIRQSRQTQQEEAQRLQAQQIQAETAQTLSQTDTAGQNALTDAAGGAG